MSHDNNPHGYVREFSQLAVYLKKISHLFLLGGD